jgi:aldehyde:ferredoxin oxidoreductase
MKGGYVGKMLFVNLTEGSTEVKELPDKLARDFIGGPSLGARVLYDMMKPGVDPLGPDNVLGFITGPLTGTGAFFASRYTVVCKSPVTGGFNDANSGGFFGEELKKAGYDAVFFSGAAKSPVYLWIKDGKAEIRDASKLWGMDTKETLKALEEETGEPKLRASVIGPAGENLSLMSCPINEGHRAPGRGGPGAVMGSKKLKAIAVRGSGQVVTANKARLAEINRKITSAMKSGPMAQMAAAFTEYGTGSFTTPSALSGDSPVKNWAGVGIVDFGEEKATRIGAPVLDAKYKVRKYVCSHCPMGCGAVYKVDTGKWPVGETERPEYETACAFGTLCLNDDAESIIKANEICNRMGLDTISVGATVAWVIEAYESGELTKEDLDGIEAKWGSGEAVVALTEKIASQEGCGKILAQGSARAAKLFGKGAQYVQAVGGVELPMHDPKFAPGYARTYETDPTPARHVKGGLAMMQMFGPPEAKYVYDRTGFLDVLLTCNTEVNNAAGLCMFLGLSGAPPEAQAEMIEAVTGEPFKGQDQLNAGMRSIDMRQAFNLREGLKPRDFVIPPRAVGKPAQQQGPVANVTIDNELLRSNLFTMLGWDRETGRPSLGALKALGLDDVAKDLYGEVAG